MTKIRLPSFDVAEAQKRAFTEADVHSKLFEPDLVSLGYPPRTNNQADGEHFLERMRRCVGTSSTAARSWRSC